MPVTLEATLHTVRPTVPVEHHLCLKCKSKYLRRVKRHGWLQKRLLPRFGYYPWMCEGCGKTVLLRSRGPIRSVGHFC